MASAGFFPIHPIQLPCVVVSCSMNSADGPLETISYTCSSGGSQYLFRRTRKLKPVDDAQVIGQLDEARKAYFREEATLVKETKVSLDGVPGDDFTYTIRSSQVIRCQVIRCQFTFSR